MKKNTTKKITLSKETLRNLTESRLTLVLGGASKAETLCCPTSGPTTCSRLC